MSDMTCRKTMMRCQTPGMCSPHGGCSTGALMQTDVRYAADAAEKSMCGQVKRYPIRAGMPDTALLFLPAEVVSASDYDALAQRCRDLEVQLENAHRATNSECMDWAREYERRRAVQAERDALRAEVERLNNRRIMIPCGEVLKVLDELRAFTLEHDSGRAGVLRGKIDEILRAR